jgi:hypothetical protein
LTTAVIEYEKKHTQTNEHGELSFWSDEDEYVIINMALVKKIHHPPFDDYRKEIGYVRAVVQQKAIMIELNDGDVFWTPGDKSWYVPAAPSFEELLKYFRRNRWGAWTP